MISKVFNEDNIIPMAIPHLYMRNKKPIERNVFQKLEGNMHK